MVMRGVYMQIFSAARFPGLKYIVHHGVIAYSLPCNSMATHGAGGRVL